MNTLHTKRNNIQTRMAISESLETFSTTITKTLPNKVLPQYTVLKRTHPKEKAGLRLKWKLITVEKYETIEQIKQNLLDDIEFIENMNTLNSMLKMKPLSLIYKEKSRDFSIESKHKKYFMFSDFANIDILKEKVQEVLQELKDAA